MATSVIGLRRLRLLEAVAVKEHFGWTQSWRFDQAEERIGAKVKFKLRRRP